MNVLLFGATGMVGQAAMRECLLDADVQHVVAVGRNATSQRHAKLRALVVPDLMDLASVESQLRGFDACIYCIGVSALGMSEQQYGRVTYDLALTIARTVVRLNPRLTFVYVSGKGTDSTEQGATMWARVKGRTENALLRLPCAAAYMFRPGVIVPLHGIQSRTWWYRVLYAIVAPISSILMRAFPHSVTTTEQLGRAMLTVARRGYATPVLETRDITAL